MSDPISGADPAVVSESSRISEVKAWLVSQFDAVGKETPRSISHFHDLMTLSQAKFQAAAIVAADFRLKAAEYRSQEILENVGLAQESLPSSGVSSAHALANVANLLNTRDTELSSFLVATGDISLRKNGVEGKRAKVEKESKILLDYIRMAIARLTYLKKTLAKLEDELAPCEKDMEKWEKNLAMMVSKEKQYQQTCANYKAVLKHVGYTTEISHGVLDKALAALAIEDKKRQYAAAEKYLEDVLQSALP
ncbi:hypothetical protein RJ641_004334 [Dillenia turbinata]|uniref:HAUS augmin-like complex subunit 1 n=1 Tax=Dillenia turbinata TaxID=194707 RepID=A0AAN8ZCV1_9MAGN